MSMRTIEMKKEHIPAVALLESRCFSHPWSEGALESELHNPAARFIVALLDGKVAGYAGMHVVLDEGYIANVAVSPETRRLGIGRALVGELLRRGGLDGLRTLSLEVRETNSGAISLYRAFGFVQVGRRRRFYADPTEDGLIFTYRYDLKEDRKDADLGN